MNDLLDHSKTHLDSSVGSIDESKFETKNCTFKQESPVTTECEVEAQWQEWTDIGSYDTNNYDESDHKMNEPMETKLSNFSIKEESENSGFYNTIPSSYVDTHHHSKTFQPINLLDFVRPIKIILEPIDTENLPHSRTIEIQNRVRNEFIPSIVDSRCAKSNKSKPKELADINAKHACTVCKKMIKGRHMPTHRRRRHLGVKPFVCFECPYESLTAMGISRHRKYHQIQYAYKCPQCTFSCPLKETLGTHVQEMHTVFEAKHQLTPRKAIADNTPEIEPSELVTEIEAHELKCRYCPMKLKTPGHLKQHEWSHTRPFVCCHCPYRASRSIDVEKHTIGIHGRKYKTRAQRTRNAEIERIAQEKGNPEFGTIAQENGNTDFGTIVQENGNTEFGTIAQENGNTDFGTIVQENGNTDFGTIAHKNGNTEYGSRAHRRDNPRSKLIPYETSPIPCWNRSWSPESSVSEVKSKAKPIQLNGGFKCKYCSTTYESLYRLRVHEGFHTRLFRCNKCQNRFGTSADLKRHQNSSYCAKGIQEYISTNFICAKCNVFFQSQVQLKQHIRVAHPKRERKHSDVILPQHLLNRKHGKARNAKTLHGASSDSVKEDGKISEKLEHEMKKMEMARDGEIDEVKLGYTSVPAAQNLQNVKAHCVFCNFKTIDSKNLRIHVKRSHAGLKEPKFSCKMCSLTFMNASTLAIHENSYHGSSYDGQTKERKSQKTKKSNKHNISQSSSSKQVQIESRAAMFSAQSTNEQETSKVTITQETSGGLKITSIRFI